jgi:hypothetical protein
MKLLAIKARTSQTAGREEYKSRNQELRAGMRATTGMMKELLVTTLGVIWKMMGPTTTQQHKAKRWT